MTSIEKSTNFEADFKIQIPYKMVAIQYKIPNAFMYPLEARQHQEIQLVGLPRMELELEKITKQFVTTRKEIHAFCAPKLDKLFRFRVDSLNGLIKNQTLTHPFEIDLNIFLEDFKIKDRFSFLYQNVILAIRVNQAGIKNLMPPNRTTESRIKPLQALPKLSFKEHLNLMQLMWLPFDSDLYERWMIASLQIEFGVLITLFLHDKKIAISDSKIHELAFFVLEAAQTFKNISKKLRGETDTRSNDKFISALEDAPFDKAEMLEKYKIDWAILPQLQELFKDAPFDEMEKSLTP